MTDNPLVYLDSTGTILYDTGTHDLLGPATADKQVSRADTAPNYFPSGTCADFTPTPVPTPVTYNFGDLDNATWSTSSTRWQPRVGVAVRDSIGKAVAAATVSGTFSHHKGTLTCVTAADGTCTLGNFTLNSGHQYDSIHGHRCSEGLLTICAEGQQRPRW